MRSRNSLVACFAILVATIFVWSTSVNAAPEKKRYIIVGADSSEVEGMIGEEGGEIHHDMLYYQGFVTKMSPVAAEKLRKKLGSSVIIEEDAVVQEAAQTIPWGITAVKAREASQYNTGYGALVCILDSGIDSDHPDLISNIAGGENFVSMNGVIDPDRWDDDRGHGTHVAGTVAARHNSYGVVGVAPRAKLFAAKVLNSSGSGYISDLAEGIASCIDNGADVINMSLSTSTDSTVLRRAIESAYDAGLVIVAAAGNNNSSVRYPAKYPQVVAVSAVDSSLKKASFSNYGPEVDFAAPGVSVLSTYPGGQYARMSGTSMAAPHVAGVAALWVASNSNGMIGTKISGLSTYYQGRGLIDALKTVLNK